MTDLNPHRDQMADPSMARTLDAQARAIWPQEIELFRRYALPPEIRILDAGCGTGEVSSRLAELYPRASVLGVDVLEERIESARSGYAGLAPRVTFETRSIYELGLPDRTFDLAVCRHVLHSIPHADRAIAELVRVTRRGGRLHLIPEDYDMLHFQRATPDPRDFWHEAPDAFGRATGTDLFVGRDTYTILTDLGLADITMDYLIVDTIRVPRETFAEIITAWRDGYAGVTSEYTSYSLEGAIAVFDQMIRNIRDPRAYAVWMVPVVSARVG